LVNAVKLLHGQSRDVRLTIVGGGQLEQQLRESVSGKDLRDVVRIAGRVEPEKMSEIYRDNDIFISASVQEGMSNAMLEAMASGLPIITTRCEGVEELITDNGVIVEDANAEDIAAAIRGLADNPQARKEMSAAARSRAQTFTWDRVAQEYLDLYEKLK